MGRETEIEWADSSVNGMMGCAGCELWSRTRVETPTNALNEQGNYPASGYRTCYAAILTDGDGRRPGFGGRNGWPESFGQPEIFPARFAEACRWSNLAGTRREKKPWLDGYPRMIFPNDMGDTWTEGLPLDWLHPYMTELQASPHIWMFLTKRPARALRFFRTRTSGVPANFLIGASVTHPANLGPRMKALRAIKERFGCTTFLSIEPLHGRLGNLWLEMSRPHPPDWVILGGGSGPMEPPVLLPWLEEVVDVTLSHGKRMFLKQLGGFPDKRGGVKAVLRGKLYHEMPEVPGIIACTP